MGFPDGSRLENLQRNDWRRCLLDPQARQEGRSFGFVAIRPSMVRSDAAARRITLYRRGRRAWISKQPRIRMARMGAGSWRNKGTAWRVWAEPGNLDFPDRLLHVAR